MLPRQTRNRATRLALPDGSVAPPAQTRIARGTESQEVSAPLTAREPHIESAYVGRYIGDRLRVGQVMAVSKMLHPRVPATIVPKIHQLFHQNGRPLTGDARYLPVTRTASIEPVAGGARLKEVCPPIEVPLATVHFRELLSEGGDPLGGSGQEDRKSQCRQRAENYARAHARKLRRPGAPAIGTCA